MANYLVHYTKKLGILRCREENLRRLLTKGVAQAKLLAAAAIVRDARIRAERAKQARISPQDTPARTAQLERIARRIEAIRASTPADILAEFRSR